MEYIGFLRGDDDGIPWVVPRTQEGGIETQPHLAEVEHLEALGEMASVCGCGCSYP